MKRILILIIASASVAVSTAGATPRTSNGEISNSDRNWLQEVEQGELKEIALGKLISKHAVHPSVRAFATRMVQDHSKANSQLLKLAAAKGVRLPRDMGKKNQETYNHLAHLSGARLDHDYIANMVVDHVGDVSTFRKEAVHGHDHDVTAWAQRIIPVLQQHLSMARNTAHQIGATQIDSKKPKA